MPFPFARFFAACFLAITNANEKTGGSQNWCLHGYGMPAGWVHSFAVVAVQCELF